MALKDYYIAMNDEISRIEAELSNWDSDTRKFIVNELAKVGYSILIEKKY